jgi:hypothetical protein
MVTSTALTNPTPKSTSSALSLLNETQIAGLARYAGSGGSDWMGDLAKCNGKTGTLTYGSQGTEIPKGTRAAALLTFGRAGYIDWQDGKPQDQAWWPLIDGPDLKALRQTLNKTNPSDWSDITLAGLPQDPYRESVMLPLVIMPSGKLLTYSNSSISGVRQVKQLVRGCVAQMRASPETTAGRVPLVELLVGHYVHPSKTVGKIFYLMLEVCDWIPAATVLRSLVATGDAGAFGLSGSVDNTTRNADLGSEPGEADPR